MIKDNTFQQFTLGQQESTQVQNAPSSTGQDFVSSPNVLQTSKSIVVGAGQNRGIVLDSNLGKVVNQILSFGDLGNLIGGKKVSLIDASANNIFEIPLLSTGMVGGTIHWVAIASDGTDHQTRTGITTFAAVDKAGTLTSDLDEIGGSVAVSTGTFTGTWSIVDGTNKITLAFTPTSSLTPTTLTLNWTLNNETGSVITKL